MPATAVIKRVLGPVGLVPLAARAKRDVLAAWEFGLADIRSTVRREKPQGLPVPPARLRNRVVGTSNLEWFLVSGKRDADTLVDFLAETRLPIEQFDSILDFGCGCGRILRHWRERNLGISGSDSDRRAIDWCRRNLRFARFEYNDLRPPLRFADGTFDLVYAFSVFTHFTEDLWHAWLAELARVIRPNGYLLITTHGEPHAEDHLPEEKRALFRSGRLMTIGQPETPSCSAFHPRAYVAENLRGHFEIVAYRASAPLDQTAVLNHDLHLLRKP